MRLDIHDNYDYKVIVDIRTVYSNSLVISMEFAFSMLTYKSFNLTILGDEAAQLVTDPLLEPAREIVRKFGEEGMNMSRFLKWLYENKETLVVHRGIPD